MTIMQTVESWWNWLWELMRMGFHDINAQFLGLLVAMVAAYFLPKLSRVFVIAIGAVIFFLVAQVMIGVLGRNEQFALPNWIVDEPQRFLGIYAGFLLVITIFFFLKKMLLRGGGGH